MIFSCIYFNATIKPFIAALLKCHHKSFCSVSKTPPKDFLALPIEFPTLPLLYGCVYSTPLYVFLSIFETLLKVLIILHHFSCYYFLLMVYFISTISINNHSHNIIFEQLKNILII